MKRIYYILCLIYLSQGVFAQEQVILPKGFAPGEELMMDTYLQQVSNPFEQSTSITTPPGLPVRTAAQWEEVQALVITWTGFPAILREIVRAAQTECKVIIHCSDSNAVKTNLTNYGIPLTNVMFIKVAFNSIWIRDYGANTCYLNDVDSLILVDWMYNRPRPADDLVPVAYADLLGIPLFQTYSVPNNLMNTGGNWMTDGLGTAFASKLVLDENDGNGSFSLSYPNHTESEIDQIIQAYHGVNRYIKMEVLPYDGIHHIDMHMKLLDEETLLVGQFPDGISDGPQMEANLQYVLSNFQSSFNTPYKVLRVPMPPSTGGSYPGAPYGNASYRNYSNFVIVNKTIIMPIYQEKYDTTAIRVIRENMPGYRIVTIDADDANGNPDLNQNIIVQGGVIHCITHLVGVKNPLRIVHNDLDNTFDVVNPYAVDAIIQHKSGIASAEVLWRTDTTQPYLSAPMTLTDAANAIWTGYIPAQPAATTVYYYIHATAVSGKEQVRPMPAPVGYWSFNVMGNADIEETVSSSVFQTPLYPNPSKGITCIPTYSYQEGDVHVFVRDIHGRLIESIYNGHVTTGERNFFVNTRHYTPGIYTITYQSRSTVLTQKLIVK